MCVIAAEPPTEYLGMLPDDRLVELYRGGAVEAFAELDRRHRAVVCSHLGRMLRGRDDVEDLAQDVMLRAAARLRYGTEPIAHLRAWVLRVAHNRAIDLIRADRPTGELPEVLVSGHDVEGESLTRLELEDTLAAVRALPDGQRRALVLNAVHGVPYEDVAEALRTTPRAAKALAFRGRATVRRHLTDDIANRCVTSAADLRLPS